MTWPGSSVTPWRASLLASQARPLTGWLRTAAATPDSSMTPLRYRSAATQRRSTSNGRIARPPRTTPALAALCPAPARPGVGGGAGGVGGGGIALAAGWPAAEHAGYEDGGGGGGGGE